jgi:hypothetical protein
MKSESYRQFVAVGMTPWTGFSPSQELHLHRATEREKTPRETTMSRMGFEPKIPVWEGEKTFSAFDSAATEIGSSLEYCNDMCLEELRRTKKYLSQDNWVAAEIRTGHITKRSQKPYRLSQSLRQPSLRMCKLPIAQRRWRCLLYRSQYSN